MGQTEPVCRSVVAYLTVRLGSIVETEVGDVARIYAEECESTAARADMMASLLGTARYTVAARGERAAS